VALKLFAAISIIHFTVYPTENSAVVLHPAYQDLASAEHEALKKTIKGERASQRKKTNYKRTLHPYHGISHGGEHFEEHTLET
ncbi:unnamed protein product, partial [Nesidiocoris tenuis]